MHQQLDLFTGPSAPSPKPSLGLVGIGAFGAFAIPHLKRHFDLRIADSRPDLASLAEGLGVGAVRLDDVASCDVVVLAVPLGALRMVARRIAPLLRPGTLVIDVCSIKHAPGAILREELPDDVDIVGTHPLFGPQSGRHGIVGLRIAVCPVRGRRGGAVARFLRDAFGLEVSRISAEAHDREMAHVQALTHLVARVLKAMGLPRIDHDVSRSNRSRDIVIDSNMIEHDVVRKPVPPFRHHALALKTTSFRHLEDLVGLVGEDSDELFRTILVDNPFARAMTADFVSAASRVLHGLYGPDTASLAEPASRAQPLSIAAQQTGFVPAPPSA